MGNRANRRRAHRRAYTAAEDEENQEHRGLHADQLCLCGLLVCSGVSQERSRSSARAQRRKVVVGFSRPVFDNHSIPIIQLFLFFSDKDCLRQKDVEFLFGFFQLTISNLRIEKIRHNRQPELHNNIDPIIECFATGIKPEEYCDSSSILIAILLEICLVFDNESLFKEILSFIDNDLSLQIVSIDSVKFNVEQLLFEKNLHNEYYVDCIERVQNGLKLLKNEADFKEFKKSVLEKKEIPNQYETDNLGLSCIRYLAHSYFKNEILPEEWRELIEEK